MPKPLAQVINGGRPGPQAPMRASIMGDRLARVMGASPEAEEAFDRRVQDQSQEAERLTAEATKHREVKREARKSRMADIMGQAREIEDNAMLEYGRVTGRPTAKDVSGRVVPAMDDTAWNAEIQKRETETAEAVRKERETARKAAHAEKVAAADLEEKRIAHQADDPALRVMPDTDRKKLEEEVGAMRNTTLAALLPEVEKRIAAKHADPEAREAALNAARMGQYDPATVAEIERDLPDAFHGEREARAKIAADDNLRSKRDELIRRRHEAAGKAMEVRAVDPLVPEVPQPKNAFEGAEVKRDLDTRHADIATRTADLNARQESLNTGYEVKVAKIEAEFGAATSGKVTMAEHALATATRRAALLAARAEMERGMLSMSADRARIQLDAEEFNAVQKRLASPTVEPTPAPAQPDQVAPASPTAPASVAMATPAAAPSGYLLTDPADPDSPPPTRLAPEEVEAIRTKAAKVVESTSKQVEEIGSSLVAGVAAGAMDAKTAETTFEARRAEVVAATAKELDAVQRETFDGVLNGRMSVEEGRTIYGSLGVEPAQFDEMLAKTQARAESYKAADEQLTAAFAKGAAPQKDFLTSATRAQQLQSGRLFGKEGAAGIGRALVDGLSLPGRLLNIYRDTTGGLGGDKEGYQARAVADRTADIRRALDETLSRHETEAAAILAQFPDLSEADAAKLKLDAARRGLAQGAVGLEEVFANVVESPESYLPFVGDLVGTAVEMGPVISAALKAKRGEELNETDEFFIESYLEGSGRDHSALGLAAEIVSQLPAFGIEIAATGGIGSAVRKGTAKGLGVALKEEALDGLTGWARKKAQARLLKEQGIRGVLGHGAASLAGTTVQTPFAMADKIASDIITKMNVPDLADFDGDTQAWIAQPGMGFGHAVAHAGYDAWVEMVSETAGGLLRLPSGLTNKLAKSSWVRAAAKLNPALSTTAVGKFARRAQLHGPLGEIFEERVGDAMRGAAYEATGGDIGTEFQWPDSTQWAGEAIGMLAGNGAFAAINARATAEGKRANRRLFEQNYAPVAAFGDWSNSGQVADAINEAFGRNPGELPYTAEEVEAIEAQIGPMAELPAVRRIGEIDQTLGEWMDRAEAMDDLETLGRATTARSAHTRSRLESAMRTIAVHRETGRTAASLAEMGAPDQAALVTGAQKLAAGRPVAEMTAAERAAWVPQPVQNPDGTVTPPPVLVEEVNGTPVVTDAGKAALHGVMGADLAEALLPMPESKARRRALNPRQTWKPKSPTSSPPAGSSSSRASAGPSPNTASTVGQKTEWVARGERGTVVRIPANAAASPEEAEAKLAALLPMGEMLSPDSVEPPSVRQPEAVAGEDEIPGLAPTDKESLTVRPLDVVRAGLVEASAKHGLTKRQTTLGARVVNVMESLGAEQVFDSVEFTPDNGEETAGMETIRMSDGTVVLRVNVPALERQAKSQKHLDAAVIEEVIHGVAIAKLPDAEVEKMWQSLPPELQEIVRKARKLNNKDAAPESDMQLGHEFVRMLIQDRAFRQRVTELAAVDSSFRESLKRFLKDLIKALRKHVGSSRPRSGPRWKIKSRR